MKNQIAVYLRTFTVIIRDERTGQEWADVITFSKEQLNSARLIHKTHEDLIYWAYNREGYRVMSIAGPTKKEAVIDLSSL